MTDSVDPETYRSLRGVMSAVDVDRPAWAERYAVGDTIAFEHPGGGIGTAPVAGFSTLAGHEGWPVIVPDADLLQHFEDRPRTIAINPEYHVPPEEVAADG